MSDFESRLKALEEACEAQDREMASQRQEHASQRQVQASLRQEQASLREEFQRLDAKIEVVRQATAERIQCELQYAWRAVSCELEGMLTAEQLSKVHDVAMRCYDVACMPCYSQV